MVAGYEGQMQTRSVPFAIAAVAILAACSGGSPPTESSCALPSGCVRADAACQCIEWQIVSVETVPIRFVVVGLVYAPLGNESAVTYGYGTATVLPSMAASSSDFGARWRSVIRAADGSEKVAAFAPGNVGPYGWTLYPVTATTVAMGQRPDSWITESSGSDVTSAQTDSLFVWMNPAAVVETDAGGGKFIRWSSAPSCIDGSACPTAAVFGLAAGWLDGTLSQANPYMQALLDAFTPAERAAILAYDPRFNPPGRDPSTVAADARFRSAGVAEATTGISVYPSPRWAPCATRLSDDGFVPFAAAEIPFGNGQTLVLQHSAVATSTSCAVQQPSLKFGTSTSGCGIGANVLIDTMFGTLLTVPTAITAACTVWRP